MAEIKENLSYILENIEKHKNTPYASENVKLLAVTKTQGVDKIKEVVDFGIKSLGENRVQELCEKYPELPSDIHWHLIGHLQTNKVKYIIDKVEMIHSLDSLELLKEINKRAANINRIMPCLVQVNIAEEEQKFGIKREEALDFIREASTFSNVKICGLMTIGPIVENKEDIRPIFRSLRELRDEIEEAHIPNVEMKELSMGMSGDYEIAVEEGATIVRVGSKIFGPRIYK